MIFIQKQGTQLMQYFNNPIVQLVIFPKTRNVIQESTINMEFKWKFQFFPMEVRSAVISHFQAPKPIFRFSEKELTGTNLRTKRTRWMTQAYRTVANYVKNFHTVGPFLQTKVMRIWRRKLEL